MITLSKTVADLMLNKYHQFIPYLKLAHASFNILVMCLFIYQLSLGLRIRGKRSAGEQPDAKLIKKHRRNGPMFVILGCAGYLAGISIVYLDKGKMVQYPSHFIIGSLIALSLISTFLVSKKIRVTKSGWRALHFVLGILIVCIYLVQVFLGLNILL